jgi:hypothetical protein
VKRMVEGFVGVVAWVGLVVFLAIMPVLLALLIVEHRRTHHRAVALLIVYTTVVGFFVGGVLGWTSNRPNWEMPFWATFASSMNAKSYGDGIGHKAEDILIRVLFSSVSGAVVAGVLAAATAKLRTRKPIRLRFIR